MVNNQSINLGHFSHVNIKPNSIVEDLSEVLHVSRPGFDSKMVRVMQHCTDTSS